MQLVPSIFFSIQTRYRVVKPRDDMFLDRLTDYWSFLATPFFHSSIECSCCLRWIQIIQNRYLFISYASIFSLQNQFSVISLKSKQVWRFGLVRKNVILPQSRNPLQIVLSCMHCNCLFSEPTQLSLWSLMRKKIRQSFLGQEYIPSLNRARISFQIFF